MCEGHHLFIFVVFVVVSFKVSKKQCHFKWFWAQKLFNCWFFLSFLFGCSKANFGTNWEGLTYSLFINPCGLFIQIQRSGGLIMRSWGRNYISNYPLAASTRHILIRFCHLYLTIEKWPVLRLETLYRSSHPGMFLEKGARKIFRKFTGEQGEGEGVIISWQVWRFFKWCIK